MKKLLLIIALLLCLPMLIAAQSSATAVTQVDVRAEVTAALYAASATLAAAERMADEKMRMQRKEIDTLRAKIQTGEKRLNDALSTAEENYIAALAARDRTYAHEIAIFRTAVENIAATPEGAAALARFNAGDEIGALAVLDDLRAARDAARQKRIDIESAAEGRNIALLALEARSKGKMTTGQVIARYEEITRLDPGVHWDWVELGRLYHEAGKLSHALRAAQAASDTVENDRDRSVALNELGDIQTAQGDLPAALKSYQNSLAIAERLAQSDPGNAGWQRDLIVSYVKLSEVTDDKAYVTKALHVALGMQKRKILAPRDAWLIEELQKRAEQ